jgi:uncharacterized protein DUF6789
MLSDSPYHTRGPALTPGGGALAGLAGSLLMLLVIAVLAPLSGLSLRELFMRIGQAVLPHGNLGHANALVLATGWYALIGAVLGLLYAVSQERIPAHGLVAVGVFYGVVIWAVSRVLSSFLFGSILRSALRSYAWFLACVSYGVLLAACAVWAARCRPRSDVALPID